jgi:arylsulfatase A-like enzyme
LRYLPVSRLHQDAAGVVRFEFRQWGDGLPLRLWEDPDLRPGPDGREAWLNKWHTEREWLAAAHRCVYANAVIGLNEHFGRFVSADLPAEESTDEALLHRFIQRRLRMAEADMLVFASNHWNFNVRGFNAGGNHGSVLRASTHSALLLAGAGIPQGLQIQEPYDSLSFVPTLLRLIGREPATKGYKFPGPVIEELFSAGTGP